MTFSSVVFITIIQLTSRELPRTGRARKNSYQLYRTITVIGGTIGLLLKIEIKLRVSFKYILQTSCYDQCILHILFLFVICITRVFLIVLILNITLMIEVTLFPLPIWYRIKPALNTRFEVYRMFVIFLNFYYQNNY